MEVRPAHISQVTDAGAGRYVEIAADAGMVADDLKRIDPSLKVRLQTDCREPFFAVYCQPDERTTYLVLTARAYQGSTGAWQGLDKRVVKRIEEIGSDGYDFEAEVDKRNRAAVKAKDDHRRQKLEEASAEGYELLRKLVGRNCGRMSVSREL